MTAPAEQPARIEESGMTVDRVGDRVHLTVNRNGQMAVQFRLTDEQALALAGRLMRATGKTTLMLDPSAAVHSV